EPPKAQPPAQPPLPVQVHVANPEPFAPEIKGTGELVPNEVVEISAELARQLVGVHVDDGKIVKKGDLLFELDRTDLEAQLARLRNQIRYARASFARFESLASSGSVSKEERDLARFRLDDALAQVGELEVQLERTRITAPFDGVFGFRPVSVGAWVMPGSPLGRLTDISRLKLDFQLPERFAAQVSPGLAIRFTVDGRAEDFVGKVIAVDNRIDRVSRSVVVRAIVEEPRGLLPGTFASVSVVLEPRDALFVPAIAVIPAPMGARLFVEENAVTRQVEVEIGHREPGRVEIVSGLSPGARVITTNLLRVRPGAAVKVIAGSGAPTSDKAAEPDKGGAR
ncbi:MAG TPA: efflux RND transporter periplasmic adaptor subunit, partial [Myxococcota bacterium]|nr:efflux RND transporter periplasmic adaptor subunit [Myxococcota bacterium]